MRKSAPSSMYTRPPELSVRNSQHPRIMVEHVCEEQNNESVLEIGQAQLIPTLCTACSSSATTTTMSLPRSDYDPRRVCINPFPEFTLGKHRRTAGVYIAGALVRCVVHLPRPVH